MINTIRKFHPSQITADEVLSDFEHNHPAREDVVEFLGEDEDELTRGELISKYESVILERWWDEPWLHYQDMCYDQSR